MKLITLNVWGGKKPALLYDFFAKYKNEIDIFCLQEMNNFSADAELDDPQRTPDLLAQIDDILEEYKHFFRPVIEEPYGQAIFVHENLSTEQEGDVFVSGTREEGIQYGGRKDHPRNIQFLKIKHKKRSFFVHNFHGMWSSEGKGDTPRRIEQSKRVADHLRKHKKPQIICGDFNMRPDTESMEIIEATGLRNLIKEHDVTDTRTSLYDKDERFADYILVSDDIKVNNFEVLPGEVSDHAPLLLDFDIKK